MKIVGRQKKGKRRKETEGNHSGIIEGGKRKRI
jgi:hypothetical protein